MKDLIESLRAALQQLAPRERLMVAAATLVVVVTVAYLALWEPVVKAQHERRAALERARALSVRLEEAAARVGSLAAPDRQVDLSTSLLAAVDRTSRADALGKAPSRMQPEGDREVKVWFDDVGFDNLLRWLQELESRYDIGPNRAEIERGDSAGTVDARLTLTRR